MAYQIRKAVVIGSGTMGGGIASLLAGVGVDTLLLDIPARDTQPGDSAAKRNAIVSEGLKRLQALRPAQLFSASDLERIRTGTIDDDLDQVADADWVIEVIVEKLDIKRSLMAKLAEAVGEQTIVSTNTSGLPIRSIADGLGDEFTRRFLGTHFFNPPRYLHLLEVIPHPNTDPAVVAFIAEFATKMLGKGVVIAKDEPNFIGNRFMSMSGTQIINYTLAHDFTVEEVDSLTGPLIGRPKTATFRLNDLVGIDIAAHVGQNLYPAIPNDPAREILHDPASEQLFETMIAKGWLGNKTGQGFYKQMKSATGEKEFWSLDLKTFEYVPPGKPRFDSVGKHRKVENTGERIRLLINEDDRAAQLLWHHHAFLLAYASQRVPEITETLVNVDNAQKWGFAHELGPFEIWDAIGVAETVPKFEAAGYPVADWVKQMLAKNFTTFYQYEAGQKIGYYSPQMLTYVPLAIDKREIKVARLRAAGKEVARNGSASVLDMGDGAALFELHSQALAIDTDVFEMLIKALDLLNSDFDALVIGHDGERFSVGANLFMVALAVQGGNLDDLKRMHKQSQDMMQAIRFASKPIVVAAHNMALGGGCETIMAASRVIAHAELYAGLVETGVGLIPGWGGCKEMVRRVVNPVMASHPNGDALPHLQKIFEQIALAKVSESAKQARDMGILGPCDRIILNRDHLLGEAKREALHMAANFIPATEHKVYAAGRDAYAALLIGIRGFVEGGYASEHDALVASKLAYVLTGGAISEPGWVDEQVFLDLEREAFLELVQTPKTLERMAYTLQTNKPLRN
ncbi:MAG TPA: 3-hydroxyacyl-CoA dehydrogenase/enoyl-CoA hydratase family protein [Phototrophicaceae bacterium]|nr:3-hydroxyacyl-CoA dehydrogenase/enoyl-CoA hydratase family protein [Phototrophicaceae bacterium]